jgi:hypothetical protein
MYAKAGKQIALSYMSVPDEADGEVDRLGEWGYLALAAANRAQVRESVKSDNRPFKARFICGMTCLNG